MTRRPVLNTLAVFFVICSLTATAWAGPSKKKSGPSKAEVANQVRTVYEDLDGTSDPEVRRLVFLGRVELGKKDRQQAIEAGVKDADTFIRATALTLAIKGGNRKLRKKANEALAKLLESGEEAERAQAMSLIKKHFKKKTVIKFLQSAATQGTPEGRAAARSRLIEMGGKIAWQVIQAGLVAGGDEPEHKQALKALRSFPGKQAYKWALTRVHDMSEVGDVARAYLVGLKHKKLVKSLDKAMKKAYIQAGLADEDGDKFMRRLRLASLLGQRGYSKMVWQTLSSTFSPDWTPPKGARLLAFKGLKTLREPKVFTHMISKRRKLRFLDVLRNIEDEAEAEAAYGWLEEWVREDGDKTVVKVFRYATGSDRNTSRMRGLQGLAVARHRKSKPLFEAAVTEGREEIRCAGARGLGSIAREQDIDDLGKLMRRDPAISVKLVLVEALSRIGSPDIIRQLQFVIRHKDASIRAAAAHALAGTGKPKALTLIGPLERDVDLNVRFTAWKLMLGMDKERALKSFKRNGVKWMKPEMITSLGNDPKAPAALLELIALQGLDEQRPLAVEALRERGSDAATRLLAVFRKSQERDTAAESLEALAQVRKKESVRTYMEATKHRFSSVRAVALGALGQYAPKGIIDVALDKMDDPDPRVRANAAMASLRLSRRKR